MARNTGKGHGSKTAVSRSAADRQERAVEKQTRQESARLARNFARSPRCELDGHEGGATCVYCGCPMVEERTVTTTDEWGRTVVVGGHNT